MISFAAEQRFIVTGASSGIGEVVSLLLNELGATVIGVGRDQKRLEGLKAKAKHPENVFLEKKDLTEDVPGLPAYVRSLKDKYGRFQGLAYCAGKGGVAPLRAVGYESMQAMFAVNYFAPVFMAKGFADSRVNVGQGAAIVAVASIGGIVAEKGQVAYAGTKAGLVASFKSIARELTGQGIRVNCVSPGMVDTPMAAASGEEYLEQARARYPWGLAEASDIADMVVFLLSPRAKWISGQNYTMDCAAY